MRDVFDERNFSNYYRQLFAHNDLPDSHKSLPYRSITVNDGGSRNVTGMLFTDNMPAGAIRVDEITYWSIIELAARRKKSAGKYLEQVIRGERVQERREAKADKYRESRARAARKEANAQRAQDQKEKKK